MVYLFSDGFQTARKREEASSSCAKLPKDLKKQKISSS
jgi:hypothetical protein